MPSYFYHLAIEIFTRSGSEPGAGAVASSSSNEQTCLSFDSACEALRPFQKQQGQGQSRHLGRRGRDNKNSKGRLSLSLDSGAGAGTSTTASGRGASTSPSNFYTKSHSTAAAVEQDNRLDNISIECIDMVAPREDQDDQTSTRTRTGSSQRRVHFKDPSVVDKNPVATGIGTDILGGLRTKGQYIPLDQQNSESVWGIVHLYRDAQETPYLIEEGDYPSELKGSSAAARQTDRIGLGLGLGSGSGSGLEHDGLVVSGGSGGGGEGDDESTTLCILAVPSYLSPSDFLGFVGETTMDEVSHFRMIRTARANRYMVLMKFRSGKKAREWQRVWNGKVFNSMEPETCHVVFVHTVEIQAVEPGLSGSENAHSNTGVSSPNPSSSIPSATLTTKPFAPPTPALIELPTCPVCLERMDETTGLLTIICQHVFHCTCLQKWKGSGCPVCRYTQDDFRKNSQSLPFEDDEVECHVCHSDINLWVCLICGTVGCGRYDGAHAYGHFKESMHAFAMDLCTHRVWDYVGDAYVHRIIQNKSDGKLVELPAADNSALDPPDWTDAVPREKLENMSVEYTHLLTSQLESQRAYFEEIVERAADKASQASAAALSAQDEATKATHSLASLQAQHSQLANEIVPGIERDKARAEKRADKFEGMARKLEKEWREEKTMNESLLGKIEFLSSEVEGLKVSNADLSEQNRDLTFFISGSERLKDQGDDIVQGTVSVPESSGKKKKKGKGKKS